MDWKEVFEWSGATCFIGGMILWMISQQLVINYTQKNLKSLCKYLFGDENYYSGKLDMYEMFFITMPNLSLFIVHHIPYKRDRNINIIVDIYKTIHPNVTKEVAEQLLKEHYKWYLLSTISLIIGFFWFGGTGLFIWLAERAG